MILKKCFSLVIYMALSINLLYGQESSLKFSRLTVEDGLSQSWVHCIYQDKHGFIWLGTDDGLNRYDGYEIVKYKYNTRDKNTISNSTIESIFEDSRGDFWIGTADVLNRYDREKNIFVRDSTWPGGHISSIVEDEHTNLWIGTYQNLYYYNPKTKQIKKYAPKNVNGIGIKDRGYLGSGYIRPIFIDSKKNVWIGTNEGLNLYVKETNTFINYYHNINDPESLGNNQINAIYEDRAGRIWIGHYGGLDLFLNADNPSPKARFKHFVHKKNSSESISSGIVNAIIEYNNELWVGVDNGGLNILKLGSNGEIKDKFTHHWHSPGQPNGLSNSSVYSFHIDKQNNIWVGTYGNGVNMYSPFAGNFKLFRNDINSESSLSSNQVNAFYEDKDFVWIGTEKGLNRLNKKDNTFKSYTYNPNDNAGISSNAVWSIYRDKNDDLWLGTWAGGLNKFNVKTEKFTHYHFNPKDTNSIGSNNIFAIYVDSDENLWLGTMGGGLNMYNRVTKKFTRYNRSNSLIYSNYAESIAGDKNGNLWIANLMLVERFNPKTRTFHNYVHNNKDSSSISGTKTFVVFCDSKKNIWIGTNVGLNLYLPKTDNFKSYQVHDGLPDNAIKSIAEDKFGNLWLGTNRGLSKFIGAVNLPKVAIFKNYSQEDGLQNNEFNRRSCLSSNEGLIYFGGENGFVIFDPSEMIENTYIPDIVFTDFLLFNKPVAIGEEGSPLSQNISETKAINLTYKQSAFTIKFVALNYVIAVKNQYAYRMEGFDQEWNYVGNKREASYTNLPAGTYTFRVKASNNDGKWNEKGISLKITILPPWWNTIWFKTILGLCILVCIIFVLKKFINKIKHLANQTILNERNQLKTLINNIPDLIIIKDTKLRYVVLNDAYINYLGGKSETEFIDKTDFDFFPKETADEFFNREFYVINTGIPIINEESRINKGGLEMIISNTKCPIINSKGETIGLICIIRDITSGKKAEQKIIKQSDELREYNNVLSESNVLLEERQQQIEEQAAELMAQTENLMEINNLLEEKQKYIQEQSDTLERTNQQLSVLNSTKDRFFSIIAHDLRNPFHTVMGFSELLLNDFDKIAAEKAKKFIRIIYESSDTGNALLENLLHWSRSQTGNIAYEPETLDLYKVVRKTFNYLNIGALRKNIALVCAFESPMMIYADENMLFTILRNLTSNAIKFTPDGGSITISCYQEGGSFLVSVKDTGIGISPENQKRLFDINSNYTTVGTRQEHGTGLGLILCREFVEYHGGKIWVESENGNGSEFKFSLPII